MSEEKAENYVHPVLNEEITSVSGYYTFIKEARLAFGGRQILYYIGHSAFDTSCCGEGGCAYAFVAGFVDTWKVDKNKDGHDISNVIKIVNESDRKEIADMLKSEEKVGQVNFN